MVSVSRHARHWGAYAAAGVAALAVLTAGEAVAKHYTNPNAGDSESHPLHVVLVSKPADASYVSAYSCKRPKDAEQDNLCIGRRSAEAMEKAALWTQVGAIFAGLGTIAISVTLIFTAIAANAAKRGAEAAFQNAQAVINAERPHLLFSDDIQLYGLYPDPNASLAGRRYSGNEPRDLFCVIHLFNQGKTPCQIESSSYWLIVGELPVVPDYGEIEKSVGVWVPAEGAPHDGTAICRPKTIDVSQRTAIMNGAVPLFLIGLVNYRGAFGDEHRSRFAYRFHAKMGERWFPENVADYWEYT